jgi:penicillin-binding protein 1C
MRLAEFNAILASLFLLAASANGTHIPGPPASSLVLDRYGNPLRTFLSAGEELFRPVELEAISPWMVLATLAAEDRRFYSHHGVDASAVVRALFQNVRAGRIVSGASTITQQLVRTLEPRPRTLWGKLREAWGALNLERNSSKQEILSAYLNGVSYGNLCRGVGMASEAYFGVPARDLSLAQAALLAGIPKSPAKYNPVGHPDNARARQRMLINRMREWGWIDRETCRIALAERPKIRFTGREFLAPQFAGLARRLSHRGQAVIRTTLDGPLQDSVEKLLRSHLGVLTGHNVTNGAVVVLDNNTGEVLAWAGSADFFDARHAGQVDGVLALRQPGSSLKPFLYGMALARGGRPSDIILDTPVFLPGGHTPRNYDELYHGPVRMREALACSYNIPAIRTIRQYGVERFLETLHAFGFDSLEQSGDYYGMGLALGSGEVSLLELANAWAALGREGAWKPARIFIDGDGREVMEGEPHRALAADASWIVLDMLSDNGSRVSAFGLNSPLNMSFPFACKTGTTKDYRDNWASGCTPDWTVAVWVGNFDGKAMRRVSGITGAAPILHDVAYEVEKRLGSRPFVVPEGIVSAEVCPDSGELRGPHCPGRMTEVFTSAGKPAEKCRLDHNNRKEEAENYGGLLSVEFPRQGDMFRVDPATPRNAQAIRLRASPEDSSAVYRWQVDGVTLENKTASAWWPLSRGWHIVACEFKGKNGMESSKPVRFYVGD